jgi:DNA polymerase elongation subunit (family B)
MIFFDIETGPLTAAEMEPRMPVFTARGNLKDEAKIKADIEEKRNKFFDNAALDPYTGRVCAIGMLHHEGEKPELIHYKGNPEYERNIILKFWNTYINSDESFCGFNIHNFDLPFLVKRSFALGITYPPRVFDKGNVRRWNSRFIDLMDYWRLGVYTDRISLKNFAIHCGLQPKESKGHFFHKLIEGTEEEVKEAEEYLLYDCQLCVDIYNKIGI